ncbi:hypothetical protein MNB_SUP05-10-264 [hydrothermal vent metagenome]|uniref:Uncharacterized protein n=1 Tax=hydrothermal vent metagenome TaxID=652676 RepID=A0A1W1D6Q1_9ZZZZ
MVLSNAGNNTNVNNKPINTPLLANTPKSATGDNSENENDHNPAAVVNEVITMARPE